MATIFYTSKKYFNRVQTAIKQMVDKTANYIEKKPRKTLGLAILFYILLFSIFSIWKYSNFLYNNIDLAIFNQVFYNSSYGRWFAFSIHPNLYLGDHFTPILIFLIPLYFLFKHPTTLLILQTIILALTAIPIFLIARQAKLSPFLSSLLAIIWLLNPILHNITLFEFHILPIAILTLLLAFYFYKKKRFFIYISCLLISLLVREDVSLVVFMFGFLPLIEKPSLTPSISSANTHHSKKHTAKTVLKSRWILVLAPIALSILYFILAIKISANYAANGKYKFFIYYSWLGQTLQEIIINILSHPLTVFKHFITIGNLEMILGFLMAFTFLPLFRLRYLILLLGPLSQILLGLPGGNSNILNTHYSSLFLPALAISFIYGFKKIYCLLQIQKEKSNFHPKTANPIKKLILSIIQERQLAIFIFFLTIIYSTTTLGPLGYMLYNIIQDPFNIETKVKQKLIKEIPKEGSVAASYEFLPHLSSREKLYSLHYAFLGINQFATSLYTLDPDTEYLLINTDDFITYQLGYSDNTFYSKYYNSGDNRIRQLLKNRNYVVLKIIDSYILFKKNYRSEIELYNTSLGSYKKENKLTTGKVLKKKLNNEIELVGYKKNKHLTASVVNPCFKLSDSCDLIALTIYLKALNRPQHNYYLQIELVNKRGKSIWEKIYPVAYGLYPTSEWKSRETVASHYYLLVPKSSNKKTHLYMSLINIAGEVRFRQDRSSYNKINKREIVGERIEIK